MKIDESKFNMRNLQKVFRKNVKHNQNAIIKRNRKKNLIHVLNLETNGTITPGVIQFNFCV